MIYRTIQEAVDAATVGESGSVLRVAAPGSDWAIKAARRLKDEFEFASSIDTANYQLCGFIMAAAELALEDDEVARRIAEKMEPERRAD